MGSSKVYLISFFLDFRAFSAGVSRRTWFTHVIEIKTVLSIKLPEIAASTADYRSALKWECPKNVSCLQKQFIVCHILCICGSPKGRKTLCDYVTEASICIHMHRKEYESYTQLQTCTLETSESLTLKPECHQLRTSSATRCLCDVATLCECENAQVGNFPSLSKITNAQLLPLRLHCLPSALEMASWGKGIRGTVLAS